MTVSGQTFHLPIGNRRLVYEKLDNVNIGCYWDIQLTTLWVETLVQQLGSVLGVKRTTVGDKRTAECHIPD